MLCPTCQNIFSSGEGPPAEEGKFSKNEHHHSTVESLEASVALGCYVCAHLWYNLCKNGGEGLSLLRSAGYRIEYYFSSGETAGLWFVLASCDYPPWSELIRWDLERIDCQATFIG